MRLFARGFRTAARRLSRSQSSTTVKDAGAGLLRQTLLVGGLGLSVLAVAHTDNSSVRGEAKCDAGPKPSAGGELQAKLDLPLDKEAFQAVGGAESRVAGLSCASYKANSPIEDKFDFATAPNGDVYALVLDGHGGWQVSEYGRQVLIGNVQKEVHQVTTPTGDASSVNAVARAIHRGYARTDRDLLAQVTAAFKLGFGAVGRCGSCALLVLVRGNTLHAANAGDARAVLGRKTTANDGGTYEAVALSQDHNAMSKIEQHKLKAQHPDEDDVFVCRSPDSCYVKGALQPTRALGDFSLKYSEFNGPPYVDGDRSAGHHVQAPYSPPYITATPDVRSRELSEDDQFVILGSDGVWDFLTNEEAVEVVREQHAKGTPEQAGRALVEKTLQKAAKQHSMTYADLLSLPTGDARRRCHDDTTAIVVFFQ